MLRKLSMTAGGEAFGNKGLVLKWPISKLTL